MIGTDAESRAQSGQRDTSFVGMIIQKLAGMLDRCCFGIDSRGAIGLAPKAGPKSSPPRSLARLKKNDLRSVWTTRRA
jgi:hypothetical protein